MKRMKFTFPIIFFFITLPPYGFRSKICHLLELKNRQQRLLFNFTSIETKHGVPQGSILGHFKTRYMLMIFPPL